MVDCGSYNATTYIEQKRKGKEKEKEKIRKDK